LPHGALTAVRIDVKLQRWIDPMVTCP